MFCFLKACWKLIWSPRVTFVFVLNAFVVHIQTWGVGVHSGRLCYLLWKVLHCGAEKQSLWYYALSELGHKCWWRCCFLKNISTHICESCGKPLVVGWEVALQWFPPWLRNMTTCWHFALSQNLNTAEGLVYFSSSGTVFTKHVSQLLCAQG